MSAQGSFDVLIVAYKNPDMLRTCLESVRRFLPESRIVVWDNSGPAFSGVRELSGDHPDIDWFLGSANIGFAAAVNRLARTTDGRDFLLLNPDAELLGDLAETTDLLAGARVAAVAPFIVDSDSDGDAREWDVAHREAGLVRCWVDSAWYSTKLRSTPFSSLYPAPPDEVGGYLTGACLAISGGAWREIGEFDEEFFLYGEEAQWQRRARNAGYRLLVAPERGVRHAGHGTVAGDGPATRRSADLLRTNIALNLEQVDGKRTADVYLAGCAVLDRVQRSGRRQRKRYRDSVTGDRPSVIITTNRLCFGGAERHHVVLATELDRRGYHVTIVCIQRFGPLIAEVPPTVRVVRMPWWAPMVDVGTQDSVLITGDTNTETGFGTLWRAGRSGRRWLVAAHTGPSPDRATYSPALGRAMSRADGFVALSPRHWTEATRFQHLGAKHFIAPNGVMTDDQLVGMPPRTIRRDGPLRLVMLSRIVEAKNPHLLVEALAGLARDGHADWCLDIFGDGPDRERLQALTPPELSDRVRWRGWSPGPEHAYANADLACMPSRHEAFPLVIVEAMARRLPVIATDVCSVSDMLDGGDAGFVVPEATVEAWRSALSDALSDRDRLQAMGEKGFQRSAELYTVEAMVDAYESAIASVLEVGR